MSNKVNIKSRAPASSQQDVEEQAGANWDVDNADRQRRSEIERDESAEQLETARHDRREAQKNLRATPRRVKMNTYRTGEHSVEATKDVPCRKWNQWDQISTVIAALAMAMVFVLGAVNVVTVLQASGNPVFVQQPWMAWIFAGLIPAVSLAIKFGYELFDSPVNRKRYAWGIYLSSIVSSLIWVVLFAISFEGASAGIVWDTLGEESLGDQLASSLTIVQIISEVLVGAALAIVIANRFASYSASWSMTNPSRGDAEKDLKDREAECKRLQAAFMDADGACAALEAERRAYVAQAVANWRSMRFGTSND